MTRPGRVGFVPAGEFACAVHRISILCLIVEMIVHSGTVDAWTMTVIDVPLLETTGKARL